MYRFEEGRLVMTTTGSSAGQRPHDLPAPPSFPPASAALFLDLDGTLAPIMPRPEHVGPDKRRAMLMKRLSATLNGRVAVVSGRALDDLDRILERGVTPVAAVHGLVRRDADGQVVRSAPHAGIPDARLLLRDLARCDKGLQFEDKGVSVALHYRNAPAAGEAVIEAAERIARTTGLVLQMGDMVVELRTPGQDKGQSVAAFLREQPFMGSTPIFVGDDLTDEDGFIAAARLGGYGILVGQMRPTAASYRLKDTAAVSAWLEGVATLMPA